MNEKEFSAFLRKHSPRPPQAPRGEWKRIERGTRPFGLLFNGLMRPQSLLAAGVALAALTLVIMPQFRTDPADQASLEPYLAELRQEFGAEPAPAPAAEEGFLDLLDTIP